MVYRICTAKQHACDCSDAEMVPCLAQLIEGYLDEIRDHMHGEPDNGYRLSAWRRAVAEICNSFPTHAALRGKPTLDQEATMEANMNARWTAEIYYQNGLSPQIVAFEELEELQQILERGLDWNDIEKIEVHPQSPLTPVVPGIPCMAS